MITVELTEVEAIIAAGILGEVSSARLFGVSTRTYDKLFDALPLAVREGLSNLEDAEPGVPGGLRELVRRYQDGVKE